MGRCEEMWGGGVGLIDAQKCTFSEGAEIVGTIYTNVHHIPLLDVHMALECVYIRMAIMHILLWNLLL